jgi:hypothetical protein
VIKEVLVVLVLAACGGSSGGSRATPEPVQHAPEISNLSLSPDTAMYMDGDGSVLATVELSFTDLGRDVQRMQVEMWDGTSFTIEISEPINTVSGTLTEEFDVSTAELGQCTVEIWLIDAAGNASNHLSAAISVIEHAPEISNFILSPDTAGFMEGDGSVRASAQLDFTDLNQDIHVLRIEMSDGTSLTIEVTEPINTASGTLTEEFDVSTADIGALTVEIWLVDNAGQSSNHLSAHVQVIGDTADASAWLERETGLPNVLNDVHWNGWQFLAVGENGTIMLSADGIAWTTVDSGTEVDLNAIAWDGYDYAVVGEKGTVLFSSDGENWTIQYKGADNISLRAAVYAGWQLIAAGMNEGSSDTAFVMSSVDHGQTWLLANVLPQSGRSITDIARGNSGFVATTKIEIYGNDREARVLTSVDGLTWVEVIVSTASVSTHSILYDGSRYWAGGRVGRIYTSPDGINWTELQTPAQATIFNAVASSGTTFIADGENEWIGWGPVPETAVATSDDGASWVWFAIDTNYDSRGLAWGDGRFVSVGCAGTEHGCAGFEPNEGGAIFSTE